MTILTEADKIAKVKTGLRKAIQKNNGDLTTQDRFEVYPQKILDMSGEFIQHNVDNIGMDSYSIDMNYNKTIPDNITHLRDYAFMNDTNLKNLILNGTSVITLGFDVFKGTQIDQGTAFIYVPDALLTQYETDTTWQPYKKQLKAISTYVEDTETPQYTYIIETVNDHFNVETVQGMLIEQMNGTK